MCSSAPNLAIFIRNSRAGRLDQKPEREIEMIQGLQQKKRGVAIYEILGLQCRAGLDQAVWWMAYCICILYMCICVFVLHSRVGVGPSGVMNSIVRPPVWFKMRLKWGLNPHFYPMECLWFDPKSIFFSSFFYCKYILLVTNIYLIQNCPHFYPSALRVFSLLVGRVISLMFRSSLWNSVFLY